ncbi:MAG TPA: HAMP domain-containing sensor histidine kinase [Solirubrobacteraceae bacterium]|nr:HAMP domain-containing sensor histidine kinase [Solirubrobacteraceae bacterium]
MTFFLVTFLSVAVIYVALAAPLTSALQNQGVTNLRNLVNNTYKLTRQRGIYDKLRGIPTEGKTTADQKKARLAAQNLAARLAGTTVSQVTVTYVTGSAATAPEGLTLAAYPDTSLNSPLNQAAADFAVEVQPGAVPPDDTVPMVISGPYGPLGVVGVGISRPGSTSGVNKVVVFSVELNDVGPLVSSVRSRILLAAALGLLVALLTGVLVARALTRRVLRLESTAQRVAQGDFEAHFSDSSGDELGQLANALAHMQSQLEGLEDARRRFIATASHELRTPIFSLGGFLELLQDEALDEDTRQQFLGQVREQVDRLGKLATQLLDLTRLESGSVELQPTTTDLGVLARAVGAEFGPALARHDSRLDLRIPEQPIRAVCDSERVAQLLRILIDNALAHTPAGTEVVVTATGARNGIGAQLSVNDTGPGIPEEAIGRVFEPFYSHDGARGAGLGLAIARELAARMNAVLEISSKPGDTTFTLTLAPDEG